MRTETFQTPGETRLDIRLGSGEVRLETAEVQETTVVLEPLRDNDASTAAVENARVELRDRGKGHEVVIDVRDRGRGIFRNAEVLVSVTCPEGTSVETKSGSAGVDVILDDRGERPGAMFADWELIGVPHRVVISDRGLKEGQVEYQHRRDSAATKVAASEASGFVKGRLQA